MSSNTRGGLAVPKGGSGDVWAATEHSTPTPDDQRYRLLKALSDLHGRGVLKPDGPHRLEGGYCFRWEINGITVLISHFPEEDGEDGHANSGEFMLELGRGKLRTCTVANALPAEQILIIRHLWGELWGGTRSMLTGLLYSLERMEARSRPQEEPASKATVPPTKTL